jgi:hypothetical protein
MSALAREIDRETVADRDPRNAALDMLRATLEGAIAFAKSQDCEPQLLAIVKGLLPGLVPPAPAADLFGKPLPNGSDVEPLPALSDLDLQVLSTECGRLLKLKMTGLAHATANSIKKHADAILANRKQSRKA